MTQMIRMLKLGYLSVNGKQVSEGNGVLKMWLTTA